MPDQAKNLLIGLFITAAAAIVIFILMFLNPSTGDEGKVIHVRFTDIDKITVGTRVTYAGKPVGEVIGISEVKEGRNAKADANGKIYFYDLTLRVDSGVQVFNTDEISARTSGLLGEKNVEITPLAPRPGIESIELNDKQVIYAEMTGSVEETFKEFKEAADKLELALDAATDIMNRIRDGNLVEKITKSAENVESITTALNKPEEWSDIIHNVQKLAQNVNTSWTNVDKTINTFNDAAENAKSLLGKGHEVIVNVSEGQGTLGRILVSDDLYLRTNSIMSKMETIMDDINHYGLLFSSDKGWQRLRARRLNLLQQLCTPQEFRNYFNDEIDQISTSLSRVYMVMNEVEGNPCCCDLMQDREFTKVFAELMRRISMLEEEVRMYNTQVVDMQVHQTELGDGSPCCYPNVMMPCFMEDYPAYFVY